MTIDSQVDKRIFCQDVLQQIRKFQNEAFQLIWVKLPVVERTLAEYGTHNFKEALSENLLSLNDLWRECFRVLRKDGTLWVLCDNYYYDGELIPIPFIVGEELQKLDFYLRNIIIWYNLEKENLSRGLVNRYSCILFASKNKNYKFNLDSIREPHIWKDVEWGGGRRSRYHPKGKNPSNFWLKTESRKGVTLRHIPLSMDEVIERCILAGSDEHDTILGIFTESTPFEEVAKKLKRNFSICNSKVAYREARIVDMNEEGSASFKKIPEVSTGRIYYKSSERMDEVPNESVQLVITSPPYWGLRDYGVKGQIGFGESYDRYLERLRKVWEECYRVLTPCGSLWVNINKRIIEGKMLLFPQDIIRTVTDVGFYLKEIVIWHKPIFVPTTGPKNLTDRHEYILFFTKQKKGYLFKLPPPNSFVDYLHERNELLGNVWKMYRKIGNIGKPIEVITAEKKIKHTAVYPEELVKRIILLCSNKGDVVLDPFVGSGTTLVVANKLGRRWIGYEINPEYKVIIDWRLKTEGSSLVPWL